MNMTDVYMCDYTLNQVGAARAHSIGYAKTAYIVCMSCLIMMLYLKFSRTYANINTNTNIDTDEREIWNSGMRRAIHTITRRHLYFNDGDNDMYIRLMNMALRKIDDNASRESILLNLAPVKLFMQVSCYTEP